LQVPITQDPADLDDGGDLGPTSIRIGLVDLPDRQSRRPLDIDLAEGGAWLVVGGPRSGRTTVLRTVLGEAVHRLGPDQLHVHVLESAGGALATDASALPHTGTAISGDDGLRTVRLIDRLAQEVAERRSRTPGSERAPFLLLLVDGVEALGALLDEADPGRGSGHLHRLIREGAAAGVTCVLTADRAIPGGRLAAVATERLVLPLPDRADYAVAGIPARAVPFHRPPGRALLGENAWECQIALPRPLCPADPAAAAGAPTPLRIVELPPEPLLPLPAPPPRGELFRQRAPLLPVGPGGDEGDPLLIDVFRTGGLLVVGPAGCGRSTALDAFARHFTAAGVDVLRIGRGDVARCEPMPDDRRDPADEAGVADWLAERAGRPSVLIADDLGAAGDAPALTRLPPPGGTGPIAVLAAGNSGQLSGYYQGPVATLRRARNGLLLCPGPGDAEFLGIRLPRVRLPVRPGCGWLVTGGSAQRVQVARRIGADGKQP
jgi:S-DNA-T family DNA segregation ATPase FtsK/SpoIIIE